MTTSTTNNLETCRKFSRTLFVPTPIGGGSNGYIYLLESVAEYTTRTGGTGYTEAVHPRAIDFTVATTNAQIVRVKRMRATDLEIETFHTHEGVRARLRKIIIANVPAKIFVGLEDAESGLDKFETRRLLETIK